jgi:hypothetical protein
MPHPSWRLWSGLMAVATVALLPLVGCSSGGGKPRSGRPAPPPTKPALPTLSLSLEVQPEATLGERIPLKLKVRNTSTEMIELALGGKPPHDFVVTGANGNQVWRWTHGMVVQDVLEVRRMEPNEALVLKGEWDQRDNRGSAVLPGTYSVRGILRTETGELESESNTFIISG